MSSAARETEQTDAPTWKSVKRMPSAAMASKCGVMPAAAGQFAPRSPQPQSSPKRITKLGLGLFEANPVASNEASAKSVNAIEATFILHHTQWTTCTLVLSQL